MHAISSKWRKPKTRRLSKKSLAGAANIRKRWEKSASEVSSVATVEEINEFDDSLQLPNANIDETVQMKSQPAYTVVNKNVWASLLSEVPCNSCKNKTLNVITHFNYGFSSKIELICENCGQKYGSTFTSPRETESRQFTVNNQVTNAFLSIGKGYASLEVFAMMMGIPCMDSRTFTKCMDNLASNNLLAKEELLKLSQDSVKTKYDELIPDAKDGNIYSISVSYDGTWQKRGHSSKFGIGIVIDSLTGLVVDYEILSKYCQDCVVAKKDLGLNTPEFEIWHSSHITECQQNYSGSSNSMEMYAAWKLWSRSVETANMRYTTMLCDGDAKTFNYLCEKKVYGNIEINKEECVNHVAKRLGTGLKNKVQEWRGKGVTLGGKKRGSLKEDTIRRLQSYYRKAIVDNAPDVQKMKSGIFASIFHCMSTDKKPMHNKCPTGESSWCFFQRALSKKETPQSHRGMKTVLSETVVEKIMPVYQRLASDNLLSKCASAQTQNKNECLHSVIWNKCPKEVFVSKKRLELAVLSAIRGFNLGCQKGLETLPSVDINEFATAIAAKRDQRRQSQRARRQKCDYKVAKYRNKIKTAAINSRNVKREGLTYGAGKF